MTERLIAACEGYWRKKQLQAISDFFFPRDVADHERFWTAAGVELFSRSIRMDNCGPQ